MRILFVFALVAAISIFIGTGVYADGDESKDGTPEKNKPDAETLQKVRELRRLMWTARNGKGDEKEDAVEGARLRERIRKVLGQLEERGIKWHKMNNVEKCDLDPEVRDKIKAMKQLRKEISEMKGEQDGEGLKAAVRKRMRIMNALRKMHLEDEDLPEELRERKMLGRGDGENGGGDKEQMQERNREREREQSGEARKGNGELPSPPDMPGKAKKAAREAVENENRNRAGEDKGQGKAEREREENRARNRAREDRENAKRKAEEASRAKRHGRK